jgi:hypothetical protein
MGRPSLVSFGAPECQGKERQRHNGRDDLQKSKTGYLTLRGIGYKCVHADGKRELTGR